MSKRTSGRCARAVACCLATASILAFSGTASAWDPTTIHVPLTERAALESELQVRWMEASDGAFGLFSSVRLDPSLLTVEERVIIVQTLASLPGSSGAYPLGGPGACPPPGSPEETQRFCVEGDLWELDALGWLRLGVFAESSPPSRVSRHFVFTSELNDADTSDDTLVSRRSNRRRDPSRGVAFLGLRPTNATASARAWFDDAAAPLSPVNLDRHLQSAATAASSTERQHHLAMGLICAGALSHVLQDVTLPAHARGDVDAFFQQLSHLPGDRGLPMQEWSRVHVGRAGVYALPAEGDDIHADLSRRALFFDPMRGAASITRAHHLSESTLPKPEVLHPSLSSSEAAEQLLAGIELETDEIEGANLTVWPAAAGYLRNQKGRALFAWRRDLDGVVTPFLDEEIFRSESITILPRALSATMRALELLFPQWPGREASLERGVLSFQLPANLRDAHVVVAVQDAFGRRGPPQMLDLPNGGPQRLAGLPIPDASSSTSVTFIAAHADGSTYVASRLFEGNTARSDEP